nr:hypothetical protein [Verrucomicrobiota bacterium]
QIARMSVADFLLVDNSNSFTKLALSSREKLGRIARIRTGDRLRKTLQGWSFQTAILGLGGMGR